MVAAKSKDVSFIVMMAGPGVNGEEILYEQAMLISKSMGIEEKQIAKQGVLQKQMYAVLKKEISLEEANEIMKDSVEFGMYCMYMI